MTARRSAGLAAPTVSVLVLLMVFGCDSSSPVAGAGERACEPLEQRPPNAEGQRPASADQTRACGVSAGVEFEVTVVARGLEHPWAVEPLPGGGGELLVTERPGRMRVVSAKGEVGEPLGGLPAVDGSAPPDNPFAGRSGAFAAIWSLGHRNVQAAAFDARGQLWAIEHGTQGGDELNRIERGENYGWPVIAYGEEYSGQAIRSDGTAKEGLEQPVYYWDPVIAPSGAEFYDGDALPAWHGSLFVGALRERRLVRLVLDEKGRVTGEEHLLTDRGQRVRDVRQGPDGALYLVTDEANGELWKVTPRTPGRR